MCCVCLSYYSSIFKLNLRHSTREMGSISLTSKNHLKHQRDTQPQNSRSQTLCFTPHQSDPLCSTAAGPSPVHKASIPALSLPCFLPKWPLPVRSYLFPIPCPWLMPPLALGDGTKGSDCDCFPSPPAFLLILPLKVPSEWIDTQVESVPVTLNLRGLWIQLVDFSFFRFLA